MRRGDQKPQRRGPRSGAGTAPPPRDDEAPARPQRPADGTHASGGANPRAGGNGPPRDLPGVRNPYVKYRPYEKPPLERARTTLFDYPSQHYGDRQQGSADYRGATPSHVIWQLLQLYTKPGDLVVDPFCGSGTTLDVCADTGRVGRGFDIAPHRADIERADARKLPIKPSIVDLVFFDPPYADNLTYSDDPKCIGKLRGDDGTWHDAMAKVIRESHRVLKVGGTLAMFVADILHVRATRRSFFPLGLQLAALAEDAGFFPIEHIAVVRRGKALEEGPGRRHAEQAGFLLRGFSHVLVFAKPDPEFADFEPDET